MTSRRITPEDRLRWAIARHLYKNHGSMPLNDLLELVKNDRAMLVIDGHPDWFTVACNGYIRLSWLSPSAIRSARKNAARQCSEVAA